MLFVDRHHTRIKEEPTSVAKGTGKRKVYSTAGSNSIGTIEQVDETEIFQSTSKRRKTGAATTHVRFDGVMATTSTRPTPKPTRKSTRSAKTTAKIENNPNSEITKLFSKLGEEFYAMGKAYETIRRTCESIVEEMNLNL